MQGCGLVTRIKAIFDFFYLIDYIIDRHSLMKFCLSYRTGGRCACMHRPRHEHRHGPATNVENEELKLCVQLAAACMNIHL